MKVRHTLMAAVLAITALVASAPSVNPAEAVPVSTSTAPVVREPRPHPTIKNISKIAPPKPRKQPASRSRSKPLWAVDFQRCVIGHESINAGLYKAQNPTSSASGAYQFVDGTWRQYARLAGFGSKYSRAKYAPPAVQDAVFFAAILRGDFYHWKGTHCGHGT